VLVLVLVFVFVLVLVRARARIFQSFDRSKTIRSSICSLALTRRRAIQTHADNRTSNCEKAARPRDEETSPIF